MRTASVFAFAAVLAAAFLGGATTAHAEACSSPLPPGAGVLPTQVTPVTLRLLQSSVYPVPGTDGAIHLAYAVQMTNTSPDKARIDLVVPVDPLNGFQPTGRNFVVDGKGRNITGLVRPFRPPLVDGVLPSTPVDTKYLEGGGSGIGFFDVVYNRPEDVPQLLSHRIAVTFPTQATIEYTDAVPVSCEPPVIISPPLVGPRWWNENGCCEIVGPHRGAMLPINGDIAPAQQFAVDFVQLTPGNGCCTGPVKELNSWPFYGAPVLAVADGVVVDKLDGVPEQVPGEIKGINVQNASGNNIIEDIGNNHYVFYAHLKVGSIPRWITIGTKLKRGEQIAAVGNTGASSAPHLHLQVMDRPSALNAVGLPFVFDRQILEGRVAGTLDETTTTYETGGTVDFIALPAPRTQLKLMPIEIQVFGYNIE